MGFGVWGLMLTMLTAPFHSHALPLPPSRPPPPVAPQLPPAVKLVSSSEAKLLPEGQRIAPDDYFLKANEFMAWLVEYRQLLFNGGVQG